MIRSSIIQFTLFVIALNIGSAPLAHSQEMHPELRIGIILPLTGPIASNGTAVKTGILMAYDQLPKMEKSQIKLFFEDDRMSPAEAVTAFSRLRSLNNIDAAINLFSGQAKAIAPLAEKDGVTLLAIGNAKGISEGKKFIFTTMPQPEEYAKVSKEYLLNIGAKNIALLTLSQEAMVSMASALKTALAGSIKISIDEEFDTQVTDFKTQLVKIKAKPEIDAVITVFYGSQLGLFVRQMRNLGITKPLFNVGAVETPETLKLGGDALVGTHYSYFPPSDPSFTNRFKAIDPNSPSDYGAYGYDALNFLISAWRHDKTTKRIPESLHSIKEFSGVAGRYGLDSNNHFILPASLKVITKDGPKFVE